MAQHNAHCILCLHPIAGGTKPEHILLNALGGRVSVRNIVCSECNALMGRGPDQDLADSVAMLRNIGNLLAGDGGRPPTIHGMHSEGITFDVRPGMQVKPLHQGKRIRIEKQGEAIDISISATSNQELQKLIGNAASAIAKDFGHTSPEVIEAIRADLVRDHKRHDAIVPAPSIRSQFQFGTGRSQQSMAKAALVLWARLVGTEEAVHSRYNEIREFIWHGDKPDDPTLLVKLDYRPPSLPEKFGINPNIIQAMSDASGAVYGYFRLYGAIGWRFLLCPAGAPPHRAQSLISNPLDNKIFALASDDAAILPLAWLSAEWNLDLAEMDPVLDRLKYLMAHGQKIAENLMIEEWVKEALQLSGCKEGDLLTEQHVKFLSEYVSKRMYVHLTKKSIRLTADDPV